MKKIGICICTYKRIRYLKIILRQLNNISIPQNTNLEIFIADNDNSKSAQSTSNYFNNTYSIPVYYCSESKQNISNTRNKVINIALKNNCDLLALIDDDEVPSLTWITDLYTNLLEHNCHGVLGPVIPIFTHPSSKWAKKTNYLLRKFKYDGEILSWPQTRTGNVLMKSEIFNNNPEPFDINFGTSGGEDLDFFKRMIEYNYKFIGINSGRVYEYVPYNRTNFTYITKRSFIQGYTNIKFLKKYGKISFIHFFKSILGIFFYIFGFIFFLSKGYIGLLKIITGLSFHAGRIFCFFMANKKVSRNEFLS